jgi:MinD superfamily P-loop ATPase
MSVKIKELVIISGKGGTGKTSVTAAFATLASLTSTAVFADCDVDAADLHLILSPEIRKRTAFVSGHEARIDGDKCISCGKCAELCRYDSVRRLADGKYAISACEGCGVCVAYCPTEAIAFPDRLCGEWYVSDTRFGPLVYAQLDAEAENSGKLVSLVRREARVRAEALEADYIIVDGCPGIGCPVIASITGADAVLAVAEPSLSSLHDLQRVIELTRHFKVPLSVAVNKFDINPEMALSIRQTCENAGVPIAGYIGYDTAFTEAQIQGKSIIEYNEYSAVAEQVKNIWKNASEVLWKR